MRNNVRAVFAKWVWPLWPVTMAGLVIGAAVGGWAMHSGGESQATALIRMYPPVDPDQIMTGAAPDPDSHQNYISGEITYLTSSGFADAVQKQLGETRTPQVSAVQDSRSSIVSLTAVRPNYAEAQRIVDAALKVYSDHAKQQIRERGQAAVDAINAVAARLATEPVPTEEPDPNAPVDTSSTLDAQHARLQELDLQRLAIEAQMQRSSALQIVQPTTRTPVTGAPGWSLGAVGGALGGGFLALAGAYIWRRRAGVVTSPSEALTGQVERVLSPVVRIGDLSDSSDAYTRLARSLYAQLPSPRTGRILVVGASTDSGSDEVTRLVASAIAEHRQVEVGYLAEDAQPAESHGGLADPDFNHAAVIDGGSVDTSPALIAAAEDASQIIVVVRLGHDFAEAIRVASRLADNTATPVSAVCTHGASRRTAVADAERQENKNAMHALERFAVTK